MMLTAVLVSSLVPAKNGAGFAGGVIGIVFLLHGLTRYVPGSLVAAAAKIVDRQNPGLVSGIRIGIGAIVSVKISCHFIVIDIFGGLFTHGLKFF